MEDQAQVRCEDPRDVPAPGSRWEACEKGQTGMPIGALVAVFVVVFVALYVVLIIRRRR